MQKHRWAAPIAVLLGLAAAALTFYLPKLSSAQLANGLYVHTVAGGGTLPAQDGGLAREARFARPEGLAVGPDGSVYLADSFGHRVWRVAGDGSLAAVAGTGTPGFGGDGGPAVSAQLNTPEGLTVGPDGSVYVGDSVNRRVRKIAPDGVISTVAGTGELGYTGDGGPATQARLGDPNDLAVGPDGTLYVLDERAGEVRRVGPDGLIDRVALDANPFGIAVDHAGALLVSDGTTHQVWRVLPGGRAEGFAGTGVGHGGFGGDGGPAVEARLNRPEGLAVGPDGSVYIADRNNHRVRQVLPDGRIRTVAASGTPGFGGDGGPAAEARMDQPLRVAVGVGVTFVNDLGNARIRVVVGSDSWPTTTTTTSTSPSTTSSTTTSTSSSTTSSSTTSTTASSTTSTSTPSSSTSSTSTTTSSTTTPELPGGASSTTSTSTPSTTSTTTPVSTTTSVPRTEPGATRTTSTTTTVPGPVAADPAPPAGTTTVPAVSEGSGPVSPPEPWEGPVVHSPTAEGPGVSSGPEADGSGAGQAGEPNQPDEPEQPDDSDGHGRSDTDSSASDEPEASDEEVGGAAAADDDGSSGGISGQLVLWAVTGALLLGVVGFTVVLLVRYSGL